MHSKVTLSSLGNQYEKKCYLGDKEPCNNGEVCGVFVKVVIPSYVMLNNKFHLNLVYKNNQQESESSWVGLVQGISKS